MTVGRTIQTHGPGSARASELHLKDNPGFSGQQEAT
jgi:hypothetical protein